MTYNFSFYVGDEERKPAEDEKRKYQDIMLNALGYSRSEKLEEYHELRREVS